MAVPIVYQNFIPPAIDAGNLNTVNNVVYTVIGDGVNAPLNGANVKTNIGLGNVDNTSDANKPLSTATVAALLAQNPGRLLGVQIFTANGTYTPTVGTTSIVVEMCGGGGGGGGTPATGAGQFSIGGGGGSGAYTKARLTSGFSGAAIVVGIAGTAGVLNGTGGTGGTSSLAALVTAPGGVGGGPSSASATPITAGGAGGTVGIGGNILLSAGKSQGPFISPFSTGAAIGGAGADSILGFGGVAPATGTNASGVSPLAGNYGAGAAGAATGASQGGAGGAAGSAGIVIIYEYS